MRNVTSVAISGGFFIFLETWIVVVMASGITGNVITMVIIGRYRRIRTSGGILIGMLSLTDALFYAMVLPLRACTFYYGYWIFHDKLCEFLAGLSHLFFGVSMCCMSAIAFNRYLLVQHPVMYRKAFGRKGLSLQLIGIWVFVAVLVLVFPLSGAWGQYGYKEETLSCTFDTSKHRSHRLVVNALGLGVPCIFIITCYSLIYYKVKKSKAKLMAWTKKKKDSTKTTENSQQRTTENDNLKNTNLGHTLTVPMDKKSRRKSVTILDEDAKNYTKENETSRTQQRGMREELKMTLTMVCTFAVFLMSMFPYTILMLIDNKNQSPVVYLLSIMLTWVNGCINPVIYVAMNVKYRQAYVQLFCTHRARGAVTDLNNTVS